MSRHSYQLQLQRNLDYMARRTKERREERSLYANHVCVLAEQAAKAYHGHDKILAEHNEKTGRYRMLVNGHASGWMTREDMEKATAYFDAAVHERELTANIPSEDI